MAIERLIVEQLHGAIANQDEDQRQLALELYQTYLDLIEKGFIDLPSEILPNNLMIRQEPISHGNFRIKVHGKEKFLTEREYKIIILLKKNEGQYVRLNTIVEELYGQQTDAAVQSFRQVLGRLRQKIELNRRKPQIIRNSYGEGYIYSDPDQNVILLEHDLTQSS